MTKNSSAVVDQAVTPGDVRLGAVDGKGADELLDVGKTKRLQWEKEGQFTSFTYPGSAKRMYLIADLLVFLQRHAERGRAERNEPPQLIQGKAHAKRRAHVPTECAHSIVGRQ
jgi:hypothetical protein